MTEHYMSANDIAFCREYDIGGVAGEPGFAAIQILHQSLNDLYPPEEETEAARFPIALRQNTRALLEAFEPIVRDRDLFGNAGVSRPSGASGARQGRSPTATGVREQPCRRTRAFGCPEVVCCQVFLMTPLTVVGATRASSKIPITPMFGKT